MGLFAPPAAYPEHELERELRLRSVLLIGAFGVARAIAPSATLVVLLTWPIGVGMGLAGALVPVAVKENFPLRPAGPTGVYTTGVQVGSLYLLPSPCRFALWYGGWRTSLVAFSLVTIAMAGVWLLVTSDAPTQERAKARSAPLAQPHRLAAGRALFADGVHARHQRLATDSYVERGWGETSAGSLLALLNLVAIPACSSFHGCQIVLGRGADGYSRWRRSSSSGCPAWCSLQRQPMHGLSRSASRTGRCSRSF